MKTLAIYIGKDCKDLCYGQTGFIKYDKTDVVCFISDSENKKFKVNKEDIYIPR